MPDHDKCIILDGIISASVQKEQAQTFVETGVSLSCKSLKKCLFKIRLDKVGIANEESKHDKDEDRNFRQTCMYLSSDDLTLQPWEQEVHFFNP